MVHPVPIVLGVDHKQAPVELRERVAFAGTALSEDLAVFRDSFDEAAILSTCNRTEIYAVVRPQQPAAALLRRILSHSRGISESVLDGVLYVHKGEDAVRHLYRVTSGLESMVLGEPQILGQVREALAIAQADGAAGSTLGRLLMEALRVGKLARTKTDLGRNRLSISHTALDVAATHLGELMGRKALVVGAGEMAELTAKLLRGAAVADLIIANRSQEHGRALAGRTAARWTPLADLARELRSVDVMFAAAAAPSHVVTPSLLGDCLDSRRSPLVAIDLGMPRNIAPELGMNRRLMLFDVDDLAGPVAEQRRRYQLEIERVEAIIEEAVSSFADWQRSRTVSPVIKMLRDHAEEVRTVELSQALRKLDHLSPRDRNVVEALSVAIVNKLLHHPITNLRSGAGSVEALSTVLQLYGLAAPTQNSPPNDGNAPQTDSDGTRPWSADGLLDRAGAVKSRG